MITEKDIEKFYRDFEAMRLVKPVATMKELTGLSSGNVSEYLSKKKKPSERFIKAFYESIYNKSDKSLRGNEGQQESDHLAETKKSQTEQALLKLAIANADLAESNKILAMKIPTTVGDDRQTFEESVWTISGLKEYLIELVAGLTKKSPDDVRDAVDNKVMQEKRRIGSKDTHQVVDGR